MAESIRSGSMLKGASDIGSMVRISLFPKDLLSYWRRCGLTADFGATFFSFCFPENETARNSLSFILNELVENAVKYSSTERSPIVITLYESGHNLIFEVKNNVEEGQKTAFVQAIEEVNSSDDLSALYLEKLTYGSMVPGNSGGIGLLTILNDFEADMAVEFNPAEGSSLEEVAVQIEINSEKVAC